MPNSIFSTAGTRTRTLIIIISSMLFVGIWIAIYSFSKNNENNKATSKISGIPENIYITPGSKSSQKYAELQQAANITGTKTAEKQGKTFIPTIIGNKSDTSEQQFKNQLSELLKEKEGTTDYERLSKQLAELLSQLSKQGNEIDNLLRLINELQKQGYNVTDLEALLKQLAKSGYNTDELAKLLASLKNQNYPINDLENMLKRLLKEGYDPDLINKILEQLLKGKIKALDDLIQQLQAGGYNTKNSDYINKIDNSELNKLLEQLANQGYKVNSLEDLLKQLMNKGYNVFNMSILLSQLKKDGYSVDKLQELLETMKRSGKELKDLRSLFDALSKNNNNSLATNAGAGLPKESMTSNSAGLSTETTRSNLQDSDENKNNSILSNLFNSNKTSSSTLSESEKKYAEILKKQQEKNLADLEAEKNKQKLMKLAQEQQAKNQQALLNSEARKKDLEAMLANMNATADSLRSSSNKITPQNFVQGEFKPSSDTTESVTNFGTQSNPTKMAASASTDKNKILKAGTILFAVLETAVNSDEPGPILARIVQPPLLNTSLLGSIQVSNNQYAEGLILSFSTANIPDRIRSYNVSAIAIDPNTARTSIATDVDHHYILRWGTIFAATFLQGYSKAIAQSGTTVSTTNNGAQSNTVTQQSPLSPRQQIYQGLGNVASAWGQGVSNLTNRPHTITINPGTSLGVLLTSDFIIPSSDEIPTEQEPNNNISKNNTSNNILNNNLGGIATTTNINNNNSITKSTVSATNDNNKNSINNANDTNNTTRIGSTINEVTENKNSNNSNNNKN